MRRLLVVPLLTLGLVAGSAQVAVGEDHRPKLPAQASERAAERASAALVKARDARAGKGGEPTMALLELRKSYDALSAGEKKQADGLLARPTNGASDQYGDGYTVAAEAPLCTTNVCVHYVRSTTDAPPPTDGPDADAHPEWVNITANQMQAVWNLQVGTYGYRAPAIDDTSGGDASKFDVYLANLGDQGLYGYCATEANVPGQPFRASGYCVLDNDYAEFPKPGLPSLRVTAPHEFFHAIQFNYDYAEDPWIMEATATWMEERFADDVDDNRQYLRYGQLMSPGVSLDTFQGAGLGQYGNWIFFERLSQTYGAGAIKAVWSRMDSAYGEARDQYSTQAIRSFLASKRMPLPKFYARFAAGNLIPNRTYSEGAFYRPAPITAGYTLTSGTKSTGRRSPRLNHLTSRNYRFVAGASLRGAWRLKVNVDLPAPGTGSAAYLIVHRKDGSKAHKPISLNRYGNATAYVGFSRSNVAAVTLTLANGSTRFKDCWVRSTPYSCSGAPLDNGRVYSFKATAVR